MTPQSKPRYRIIWDHCFKEHPYFWQVGTQDIYWVTEGRVVRSDYKLDDTRLNRRIL